LRGGIQDGEQDHSTLDVGTSYPPRADEHRPAPELREIMFHLNIIKLAVHLRKTNSAAIVRGTGSYFPRSLRIILI
jgi:hypothetical protein